MTRIRLYVGKEQVDRNTAKMEREIMRVPTMNNYGLLRRRKTELAYPASAELADLVVVSRLTNGMHSPVLDLDFSATLFPSSTAGHHHLYLDGLQLPWWRYRVLLRVLAWAGVIEKAYYKHSVRRRHTAVRFPNVRKGPAQGRRN